MSNRNEERIIQKTSEKWVALLSTSDEKKGQRGSLILTNKNIIFKHEPRYGNLEVNIPITEISNVDVETRWGDVPKISVYTNEKIVNLEFSRQSTGHSMSLFAGDIGRSFMHSELSAFTSYWASLITMVKFHYGVTEVYEIPEQIITAARTAGDAWCGRCKKYLNAHSEVPDTPVWKLRCPDCGHLGMTTLSPFDRARKEMEVT